ncbi:hypothetical protein LMG26842_05282 [Achromobacter dolens]|nr:hypothetical protein LMG26842_05282 [Achromobacter dolens]
MAAGWKARLARVLGDWVPEVGPATLRADLTAGLLGALLVLPQGVAFATLAGLPAQYGLYSAIVPCIVAALFGSSRHVMSGPTNANSLALFAVLTPLAVAGSPGYIELALAVTVLVGLMQWLVGALRLGSLAHFISPSALFGFTSGAALLIAVHALKDALGLPAPDSHGAGALLASLAGHWDQSLAGALLVTAVTIAAALLLRRLDRRRPYMLAGLVAGGAGRGGVQCAGGAPWRRAGAAPGRSGAAVAALPRAQHRLARLARSAQPGVRIDHRGAGAIDFHRQGGGDAFGTAHRRQS